MTTRFTDFPANFRFPGVLDSRQLLIAESIQARAWHALQGGAQLSAEEEDSARDRLGRIIVRLMIERSASVSELAAAATAEFKAELAPARSAAVTSDAAS